MIKQVFSGIFQIKVPLPHSPLIHLNSYLLRSEEKNILIDTGLNFSQSFQSLRRGLSEASIELEDLTEVILTHFHVDHVGLIPRLIEASGNIKISIHPIEAELCRILSSTYKDLFAKIETFLKSNGTPSSIALKLTESHPLHEPKIIRPYQELAVATHPLEDGQVISVGDYHFQIVCTPGHSPGHICLYEPSFKILISGDHLLPSITPHVALWWFTENMNPLADYLNSLKKIEKLDIEVVLPAHEETFINHCERIKQLQDHHNQRLMEILTSSNSRRFTAYMKASQVHWNINYKSWNTFLPFQKYLALGETIAHLYFLEKKQLIKRTMVDQVLYYSINEKAKKRKKY